MRYMENESIITIEYSNPNCIDIPVEDIEITETADYVIIE